MSETPQTTPEQNQPPQSEQTPPANQPDQQQQSPDPGPTAESQPELAEKLI